MLATTYQFKDGTLLVAGKTLPAPSVRGGQIPLFDGLKELLHDDLEAIARCLGIVNHGLVPTDKLLGRVGAELQLRWYQQVSPQGEVPVNVLANYERLVAEHQDLVANLTKGRIDMKTKGGKKSKAVRATPRGQLYGVSAKNAKELGPQAEIVYKTIKGVGPAKLATIAKACGDKLKTKQEVERVVAFYLAQFKKLGLVKTSEEATA